MKSKGKVIFFATAMLATWLIPFPKLRKGNGDTTPSDDLSHSLAGTVPEARPHFQKLVEQATEWGMRPWIISALRPCTKFKPGSAVAGCKSWHTLGRAIDLQLQSRAGQIADREPYEKLGRYWENMGGIWGGNWAKSYPNGIPGYENAGPGDVVHFQWTGGLVGVPDSICTHDDCEGSVARYLATEGLNV